MKTLLRPNEARWHKSDDWKQSAYAFVPNQTHFGELCGFADDIVAAGQGFGMHPHQNMEISTIMMAGAQKHRDDSGGKGYLDAQSLQTMSAGTGIMHSEFNASATESFHSYQIWIYPKILNVAPRYGHFAFTPDQKQNQILLCISPDGRSGTAMIHQDAFFSVSHLAVSHALDYRMHLPGNGVYIHCASGRVEIAGQTLQAGDAIGVYETEALQLQAIETSELVFVEVPMHRGVKV
jgi:quercetin 2,3-dioxygenase